MVHEARHEALGLRQGVQHADEGGGYMGMMMVTIVGQCSARARAVACHGNACKARGGGGSSTALTRLWRSKHAIQYIPLVHSLAPCTDHTAVRVVDGGWGRCRRVRHWQGRRMRGCKAVPTPLPPAPASSPCRMPAPARCPWWATTTLTTVGTLTTAGTGRGAGMSAHGATHGSDFQGLLCWGLGGM